MQKYGRVRPAVFLRYPDIAKKLKKSRTKVCFFENIMLQ